MRKIVFLFAALLVVPFSLATYITINAQLPEIYTNYNTAAKFTVSNTGDEPAFSVHATMKSANGIEFPSLFIGKLEPNKQVDTFFAVNITKDLLPGRYPVFVTTEYADANNYPFSAVSTSFFVYKDRTSSDVSAVLGDAQIPKGGKGRIELKLVNRDSVGRSVNVSLFVPKELFVSSYNKNVFLNPGEQKSVYLEVSSLSALQGSTYTIFASAEYENNNAHYSSLSRSSINITKDAGIFSNVAVGAAVVVFLLVVFAYNFRIKKR